ncbi:site-specific integrase [Carnobacterium maltaromaticum]|uniref:Site-specific integrase n=1 Tax=Carnobacterium maltaromaticum TaxID=2751 RepID=A0AAW9JXW2_CARML|nr:site-specific integrase [Carnobacterium maltaromaticum]MDZ5757531.1 site-specific integrase [Carnobacterium maltaromaticum]
MSTVVYSKKYDYVYSYQTKKGKLWGYRFNYYSSSNIRKEIGKRKFISEKEAYRDLLTVQEQVEKGNFKAIENNKLTIKEYCYVWLESQQSKNRSINTIRGAKTTIELHIIPRIGHLKIQAISRFEYERLFLEDLLKTTSARSVETHHKRFMAIINSAVKNEIILANKFKGFNFSDYEVENIKNKYFSKKEAAKFLNKLELLDYRKKTVFYLLFSTGMRKGELLALRWQDIDLKKGEIDISRTRGDQKISTPKTKSSIRKIQIDSSTIEMLNKYKMNERKFLLSNGEKLNETDLFATNRYGNPISYCGITEQFRLFCNDNDLPYITLHGLRHTHATLLLEANANIKYISRRLGHKNIEITLNTYSHVLIEKELETAEIFSNVVTNLAKLG